MYNEYEILVKDIQNNKEFNKLEKERHHGTNRLIHSKRVSYYSYKICKILRLDYVAVARAGLLHDFFIYEENSTDWDRFKLIFTHPRQALNNSKKYYHLNPKEENIIISHMFPIGTLPMYIESWIVQAVDKVIATYEFSETLSEIIYTKKEIIRELIKQN